MQEMCIRAELLLCCSKEKAVSLFHSAMADLDTTGLRWRMKTCGISLAVHSGAPEQFVFTFMVIVHPRVKPSCSCRIFKTKQALDHSVRPRHIFCQSLRPFYGHLSGNSIKIKGRPVCCSLWRKLSDETLVECFSIFFLGQVHQVQITPSSPVF